MIEARDTAVSPFADRTGRGVKIAVIDSGVHPGHPHIRADRLAPGALVLPDGTLLAHEVDTIDRLGHGTAVTAAIQEKAPDATILPIRVFRDGLKASSGALISAMRWAIGQEVHIVNLSLGSTNEAHVPYFERVVAEARMAGALLVAAQETDGRLCFPGALDGVLGVGLDWDVPRETFREPLANETAALYASGYPRPIDGVPLQRNLHGISFAVAQVTGFAARACEDIGHDAHAIRQALIRAID